MCASYAFWELRLRWIVSLRPILVIILICPCPIIKWVCYDCMIHPYLQNITYNIPFCKSSIGWAVQPPVTQNANAFINITLTNIYVHLALGSIRIKLNSCKCLKKNSYYSIVCRVMRFSTDKTLNLEKRKKKTAILYFI